MGNCDNDKLVLKKYCTLAQLNVKTKLKKTNVHLLGQPPSKNTKLH